MRSFVCVAAALVVAGTAGADAPPGPARMEAVVRQWSAELNAGHNAALAKLFRPPVVMVQGQYAYRLTTARQIAIWHAALPCAGEIVSIDVEGRYATAVFRLGNRPGSKCDAPGQLAAARFGFAGGRIVSWEQVAVPATGGRA